MVRRNGSSLFHSSQDTGRILSNDDFFVCIILFCLLFVYPRTLSPWPRLRWWSKATWSQEHESISVAGTDSSVILSGLMPNTEYKVRVSASNSLGKSKPSHELLIRTDEEGEFLSVFLRNEKKVTRVRCHFRVSYFWCLDDQMKINGRTFTSSSLMVIFFYAFRSLAPSQVTSGVRTETISSTSIRVVWSLPHSFSYHSSTSKRDYEGFYLGYRELDQRLVGPGVATAVTPTGSTSIHSKEPLHSYSFKTINIPAGELQREFNATLSDLKRNTRYGVIVQVFNRKGPGPSSSEVTAFTYEYGMIALFLITSLSLKKSIFITLNDDNDSEQMLQDWVPWKPCLDIITQLPCHGRR